MQHKYFVIETSPFLKKWNKCSYMIWKNIFSFLMCMQNIYTVFGVSLAVLGWNSKIDSGSKVFIFFF